MAFPQRKAKPQLTLIPEEERAINHRFTVVLVAENAREFASVAVHSEMAEAFRPKSKTRARDLPSDGEPFTHVLGVTASAEALPLDVVQPKPPPPPDRSQDQQVADERLFVFCPMGSNSKDLARLRLHPCAGFSDSMPLSRDPAAASTTVVAFIFWDVKPGATDSTINEWYSRMAEINHLPANCKPYTVVLAYGATQEQEQSLRAFAERQAGKIQPPRFVDAGCDESIMESLQDLAQEAVAKVKRGNTVTTLPAGAKGSRGCSIM